MDDSVYVKNKIISLRRSGKSAKAIQIYLRGKNVPLDTIKEALDQFDHEHFETPNDAEYQAAITFARKKRIGPFRKDKEKDIQKELGRLARAGFSYDTSRRVLENDTEDF